MAATLLELGDVIEMSAFCPAAVNCMLVGLSANGDPAGAGVAVGIEVPVGVAVAVGVVLAIGRGDDTGVKVTGPPPPPSQAVSATRARMAAPATGERRAANKRK